MTVSAWFWNGRMKSDVQFLHQDRTIFVWFSSNVSAKNIRQRRTKLHIPQSSHGTNRFTPTKHSWSHQSAPSQLKRSQPIKATANHQSCELDWSTECCRILKAIINMFSAKVPRDTISMWYQLKCKVSCILPSRPLGSRVVNLNVYTVILGEMLVDFF